MTSKRENMWRMIGMLIPIFVSFIALGVQWGMITTKLDVFEDRLNESIQSKNKMCDTLDAIAKEVSYIKGKMGG